MLILRRLQARDRGVDRVGLEKFRASGDFRTSDLFTATESAVLAYAEEATLQKDGSDETFASW